MLGEFEYLLITATAVLADDAYGAAIRQEIESTTGRKCSIGALYTTIDRLEKRGLVERRRSREDRRQVFVEFTDAGRAARQEAHQQFIGRIHTILLAMSEEGRSSLLRGLEEFVQVGLSVPEIHSEEEM